MEYDPAVSTHKASSITSTTSTSSNSTWDHPISTPSYIHSIKTEDGKPAFEEYPFDAALVADRISIPTFDYAEESNNFHFHDKLPKKRNYTNLMDPFITSTDTDNTNIAKENHEKLNDSHGKNQLNHTVTHDNSMMYSSTSTIALPSYGEQQPTPIYLQHGDQITVPSISMIHQNRRRRSSSNSSSNHHDMYASSQQPRPIRPYTSSSSTTTANDTKMDHRQHHKRSESPNLSVNGGKRSKLNRDLLTDDEKRVNHIASEQKRRNTIRMGFKEMTEIIPTLKNINNSKSTILFKAVEYIKHLDKRNRGLREKIASLQVRMKVEGRMAEHQAKYYRNSGTSNAERYNKVFSSKQQQNTYHQHLYSSQNDGNVTSASKGAMANDFSHLPAHTVSALLAHKNQQRQLEELQEQLRMQQQLLAKHNIITPQLQQQESAAVEDNYRQQPPPSDKKKELQRQQHHYNSISIPSSRSSHSEENEPHTLPYPSTTVSFIVPQDPSEQQQQQLPTTSPTTRRRPWHHDT